MADFKPLGIPIHETGGGELSKKVQDALSLVEEIFNKSGVMNSNFSFPGAQSAVSGSDVAKHVSGIHIIPKGGVAGFLPEASKLASGEALPSKAITLSQSAAEMMDPHEIATAFIHEFEIGRAHV